MIQAICTAYVERFHLSPTPRISVGIHRTADSVSAPRVSHPRQDLCFSAAPIACDGFAPQGTYHARTVAGQEYHYPYCLSSPYRELPGTYSRLFSLRIRQDRPRTEQSINQVAFPLSFAWYIMAQSLTWLMLITKAIGKYPMNGYSVVKEHRIFQKKDPSLYLPLSEGSDNR